MPVLPIFNLAGSASEEKQLMNSASTAAGAATPVVDPSPGKEEARQCRCTLAGTPAASLIPKLQPLLQYLDALHGPADLNTLQQLLNNLDISRADVEPACVFSDSTYRRNPLQTGPSYDLLLICWRPGQQSAIHDHAGSACAFRVVAGVGTEIRYLLVPGARGVRPDQTRRLNTGDVCCAVDKDIHRVANLSDHGEDLITLHLYSPPLRMNVYQEVDDDKDVSSAS
jgi:cysteine dioxygenase